MKNCKKLIGITFTPTFLANGIVVNPKVLGTGRFRFEWDDHSYSHPYWICSHKDTGELYLWSTNVKLFEISQELQLNLHVILETMKRSITRFECYLTNNNRRWNKGKAALGRFRIDLKKLDVTKMRKEEIKRRVVKSRVGDDRVRVKLSEMERI